MSSVLMPKEQVSGLRRWELDSFDPAGRHAPHPGEQLPTAAQLEQLHQQAHAEGYATGREEGRAAAARQAAELQAVAAGLQEALRRLDEGVAEELLAFGVALARQLVGETLRIKPEAVLTVVREALRELPQARSELLFVLHPADAALVREHLAERAGQPGWRIVEDPQLARGGCRIETGAGEVDASLPTRWSQVLGALGQDSSWLE